MEYRVGFYGQSISGNYGSYTSKTSARKAVRKMAKGNCTAGQSIRWFVEDLDGNTIFSGTVRN